MNPYKQENKRDNDPLGQLRIAMVAAQRKNTTQKYCMAAIFRVETGFFALLEGQNYAVSAAHDAINTLVCKIFFSDYYV